MRLCSRTGGSGRRSCGAARGGPLGRLLVGNAPEGGRGTPAHQRCRTNDQTHHTPLAIRFSGPSVASRCPTDPGPEESLGGIKEQKGDEQRTKREQNRQGDV